MSRFARQFGPVYEAIRRDIFKFCALMNFRPTWQQAEVLALVQAGHKRIAIKSGQGPGKCVVQTTIVQDVTTGEARTIREWAESGRPIRTAGIDERTGKQRIGQAVAFASGEKPCVRVRVDAGQDIELSTDHPIFTPAGWVDAALLRPGDLVAMPRRHPIPLEPLGVSDEEVRAVAYLMADGCCGSGSSIKYTDEPGPQFDEALEDLIAIGGEISGVSRCGKALQARFRRLAPFVRKWGIDTLSKHKRVPAEFFGLVDEQLALFLSRLWAADGYLQESGPAITFASKGFVEDVQWLLLRFGIHSRFRYKQAKCQTGTFDAWTLTVSGRSNVLAFFRALGPILGKEAASEAMIERFEAVTENTNTDIVPIRAEQMRVILDEELRLPHNRGRGRSGGPRTRARELCRGRSSAYPSRDKFRRFCAEFGYTGRFAWLADADVYWVKVESVEDIGVQPVYDLTVPGIGNFVANNLIVHNTTVSVIVGLWRTLRYVDALTIITAPTMRQAKEFWLSECRRLMEKADPALQKFIEVTKSSVQVAGRPDWGVRLVTATRAENAQGLHQDNLSVIVEEASGIEKEIIEQFEGTLTNDDALLFQIGNPNTRDCAFFDCFNSQRHRWATLTLNAAESPIVSRENIAYMAEKYGEDSDVYRIRVLGEFPLMDPNCVISSEDCDRATAKAKFLECAKMHRAGGLARQFGIDLARFGADESVIYRRVGNAVMPDWKAFSKREPGHVIEHAFRMQSDALWSDKDCWYVVDAGGMGQGVMFKLHDARKNVFEFHTQGTSSKADYDNRMTEAWFHIADLFRKGHIYIPNDNRLIQQLSTRQYHVTKKGKLIVESKDDYKKRATSDEGASPDRADALVMAFYDQVVVQGIVSGAPDGRSVGMKARIA